MSEAASGPLKVLCSSGLAGVLRELAPQIEAEIGAALSVEYGPTNILLGKLDAAPEFDVAILTATAIENLTERGVIAQGSRRDLARSGVGVTIRPGGGPPPKIGTIAAFKDLLQRAESIIYTSQGASGQYFASLLPRLGLVDEVVRKATIVPGGLVAEAVVHGRVEVGIQQISEILAVPSAILLGPLPPGLQKYTVFSAGIGAHASQPERAQALIARLAAPATLELATTKGLEPV